MNIVSDNFNLNINVNRITEYDNINGVQGYGKTDTESLITQSGNVSYAVTESDCLPTDVGPILGSSATVYTGKNIITIPTTSTEEPYCWVRLEPGFYYFENMLNFLMAHSSIVIWDSEEGLEDSSGTLAYDFFYVPNITNRAFFLRLENNETLYNTITIYKLYNDPTV